MSRSSRTSRFIISLSAALIALFFFLSIDKYKVSYEEWSYKLAQLRLASQELDGAVLKIRGGLRVDYDQLADKSNLISTLSSSLGKEDGIRTNEGALVDFSGALKHLNQRHIDFPVDSVVNLVSERTELIEDFKSNFSVLRNSQLIIFQLINDVRDNYANNTLLIDDLNSLERIVLHIIQFPDDRYRKSLEDQLQSIQSKYSGDNSPDVGEFIGYVVDHFNVIMARESTIESILKQEVALVEALETELDSLESQLTEFYAVESRRSVVFSYAFAFVAVFVLVFGAIQSRRSYALAKQLIGQNENLEGIVAQRTEHLESAKDKLQKEKHEREELLVELDESRKKLDTLINNIHGCVYEYSVLDMTVNYISRGAEGIWGICSDRIDDVNAIRRTIHPDDVDVYRSRINEAIEEQSTLNLEYRVVRPDESIVWIREISTPISAEGNVHSIVGVAVDITEFKQAGEEKQRIEDELAHAQKLESVGQLAAGVAHEINTPAQFISDNLLFLQESVDEILQLVSDLEKRVKESEVADLTAEVDKLIEEADMEYLSEEVPPALKQSYEGISRIAKIVRAMKDYSHPGESMELSDINSAIESTIIVSRTEWKYFATLETEFEDDLPMVECVVGDVNQVVLNMIVNAAHAIVDKYDNPDDLEGKIVIRTMTAGDSVHIEICDNGNGMPDSVKQKIFDQFFTTKEVGKGTGQGLSIAYRLIVDGHGGKIEVDSEVGVGTTFRIILPIAQSKAITEEAEDLAFS